MIEIGIDLLDPIQKLSKINNKAQHIEWCAECPHFDICSGGCAIFNDRPKNIKELYKELL